MTAQPRKSNVPIRVRLRSGKIAKYKEDLIRNTILKIATTCNVKAAKTFSKKTAQEVTAYLTEKKKFTPTGTEIEEIIENILMSCSHKELAKKFIIEREAKKRTEKVKDIFSETIKIMDDYLGARDWRVKENSNMTFSVQGMNNHISSSITAKYWLDRLYPSEIADAHKFGYLHIHDLGSLACYCCGWDLEDLLMTGIKGVSEKTTSAPASHFSSILGQIMNFLYILQGEIAGAVALSSFDTLLAPFVKNDKLNQKQVKQGIQEFVYNMNSPLRTGFQQTFSNLTMDMVPPSTYKDKPAIIGGKLVDFTYGDCAKEMDMINLAFAETMLEGDARGAIHSFPIPTYNITKDFIWDSPAAKKIWEMTAKLGVPYFANMVSSGINPEDIRSMCCRISIDNRELRKRLGGIFASAPLTGCYDEETEVLTAKGWKHFRNLTDNDELYTLSDENQIEMHKPKKRIMYNHDGDMFQIKAKSFDLLVTPNHNMVVDVRETGERKLVEMKDFSFGHHIIPKQGEWNTGRDRKDESTGIEIPAIGYTKYGRQGRTPYKVKKKAVFVKMKTWMQFFGIWTAEGCTDETEELAKSHGYRTIITQKKKENRVKIEEMLDSFPFKYSMDGPNYVIYSKQLWTFMRPYGKSLEKRFGDYIKDLPRHHLMTLFNWFVMGDGHVRKSTGQINCWTSSKGLADDLQEIVMKLGWQATISERNGKISVIRGRIIRQKHTNYCIGVQKSAHYRLRKNNIKRVHYKGKVYCCEVENHSMLVRRNGKVTWCGNSVGVVTLNLPRLAYIAADKDEFFDNIEGYMEAARDSLEIKRRILETHMEKNLYPYSKFFLRSVKERSGKYYTNHFSTIGLVGMHEACQNLIDEGIQTKNGTALAKETLEFMRTQTQQFQEATGNLYNLEATPAEGAAYRLAKSDIKQLGDKISHAGTKEIYYTNSTHLPVGLTSNMLKAIEHQNQLQPLYTGGTVFHIFLGEQVSDPSAVAALVKKIMNNYKLPYISVTPTFSTCEEHGYLVGEHHKCPHEGCTSIINVYSRVVGYYRPVASWNNGKKEEYSERKTYELPKT